jgi:riboflavin kinase
LCSLLDVRPCAWALPPLHDWVARALPLQPLLRLKGPVVRGFGRGSKLLGIPTANLDADALGPAVAHAAVSGIYIAWASVGPAPAAIHKAVLSIGWCDALLCGFVFRKRAASPQRERKRKRNCNR